jgi:Na+/proline symporter
MGTMGLALVAVAAATYLMAIGHDAVSWTGYAIAGFVTLIMPLVPWRHVRQLRRMLAAL